jgi:hypothetical protein
VDSNQESGASSSERLNYFNYFTEVEEEFVRRRGKSLLVSPMDWALIESWKNAGIPLHIVLRAINRAFDAYDARRRKYRLVNSVFYCQQEVESTYAEYRLAQVGGKATEISETAKSDEREIAPAFPKSVLLEFFARSDAELSSAQQYAEEGDRPQVKDAIERARARLRALAEEVKVSAAPDAESIERDMDLIDRLVLDQLRLSAGEEGLRALGREAESLLKSYRRKMDRAVYEQTITNFIARRLREMNQVPRLSLFYL